MATGGKKRGLKGVSHRIGEREARKGISEQMEEVQRQRKGRELADQVNPELADIAARAEFNNAHRTWYKKGVEERRSSTTNRQAANQSSGATMNTNTNETPNNSTGTEQQSQQAAPAKQGLWAAVKAHVANNRAVYGALAGAAVAAGGMVVTSKVMAKKEAPASDTGMAL